MRTGALCAALLLLPAAHAAAGSITLRLSASAELRDGALRVALTVTNQGDAEALALRPRLQFLGREEKGAAHRSLAPGASLDAVLALEAAPGAGRWPFALAVDYADANAHPFQAFSAGLVTLGEPPPFGLLLDGVRATPLDDRGTLFVTLRNPAGPERRARVRALVSADLDPPAEAKDVLVRSGRSEVALPLGIRTALAGNRYVAFVVVECDEAGFHQALLGETLVEVRARRPLLFAPLLAAGLLLLLVWGAALLVRRSRSASPA